MPIGLWASLRRRSGIGPLKLFVLDRQWRHCLRWYQCKEVFPNIQVNPETSMDINIEAIKDIKIT